MSKLINAGQFAANDEEVLGVFGRLKDNINEIKTANTSRNSVDRSMDPHLGGNTVDAGNRGKTSRQNSFVSERRSDIRSSQLPSNGTGRDAHKKEQNGSTRPEEPGKAARRSSTRSRQESYSSRAAHDGPSTSMGHAPTSRRPSTLFRPESETGANVSIPSTRDYSSLKREHSKRSNGRDSRTSERSYRSSRPSKQELEDQYLQAYHRSWLMQWNQQVGHQMGQNSYGTVYQPQPATGFQTIPSVPSTSSLSGMVYQPVSLPTPSSEMAAKFFQSKPYPLQPVHPVSTLSPQQVQPSAAAINGKVQNPTLKTLPSSAFKPVLAASSGHFPKMLKKIQKAEWKGGLRSLTHTAFVSRSERSSTVVIKETYSAEVEKNRTEMLMFPGIMLWDSSQLRDRVVDFGRHMSSLCREAEETSSSEMEAAFWDLVVHFVSRGENSRPYEVAEILSRLVPESTGRSSVASVRSEAVRSGRDRYSENHLANVRKCLLAGDIESAVKYAESGDCWDLAFCLQSVSSNVECKNQQANDLAMKSLDQRIQRGDPVHTICSLACGKMPNVEACFKDWVSNLAIVLACSSFISLEELRLRFITALSDVLYGANMQLASDICTIFGNPERRFHMQPFVLIGANWDGSSGFCLPNFFMTEIFVYLAQILQGVNLHASVDLVRMELMFVQQLLDVNLTEQAVNYCRGIVMVVKEYNVQMGFEVYAQLFELASACVFSCRPEFQEEWFQWLWNIFVVYKSGHSAAQQLEPGTVADSGSSQMKKFYIDDQASNPSPTESHSVVENQIPLTEYVPEEHYNQSRRQSEDVFLQPFPVQQPISAMEPQNDSRRQSESLSVASYQSDQPTDTFVQHLNIQEIASVRSDRSGSVSNSGIQPPVIPSSHVGVPSAESDAAPPSVPMFFSSNSGPARPSFFGSFPTPGDLSNSNTPGLEDYSSGTPVGDFGNNNSGDALYYSQQNANDNGLSENEDKDEQENKKPQLYDPTQDLGDVNTGVVGKNSVSKKDDAQNKTDLELKKSQNPGWWGNIFKKPLGMFKRKGQIHLPDDSKPTLVYDKEKKRWVDTSKPEGEADAVLPPPPKMTFPQAQHQSLNPSPGMPPIPNGNAFRIGGGPSSTNIYNPYATIMANMQTAPYKPIDMTNHFIPAPSIPEE